MWDRTGLCKINITQRTVFDSSSLKAASAEICVPPHTNTTHLYHGLAPWVCVIKAKRRKTEHGVKPIFMAFLVWWSRKRMNDKTREVKSHVQSHRARGPEPCWGVSLAADTSSPSVLAEDSTVCLLQQTESRHLHVTWHSFLLSSHQQSEHTVDAAEVVGAWETTLTGAGSFACCPAWPFLAALGR